ncbi:MAG: long-chain-fatty-acid--CoA ligase [Desulfobacterales bacterium]|jgi:acyl-CoA synthetase (AMP-forming)/AMP-acid ligase II
MTAKLVLRELSRYPIGTFADIIYRNALLYPDSEAFVCGSHRTSFSSFNEQVNRLVHGLQAAGVQKGEVVGILSWSRLEYCEVFGAAMKGGFLLAHFNPRLQAEELTHVINDAEARVIFLGHEFIEIIDSLRQRLLKTKIFVVFGNEAELMRAYEDFLKTQPMEEPDVTLNEDDPLVIFYTSGTTGLPRGAIYTHKQKMENVCMKALDIGADFGDRHLVVLQMFHTGGDSHVWPFFLRGGCNVIIADPSFDPVVTLQTIAEEQITDVHIVPTQLVSLLNLPGIEDYDLGKLKRIWYAASPMPTEVLKRGISVFGPIFIQGYGLSESGPHSTVLNQASHRRSSLSAQEPGVLASCGQPCVGVHIRIIDEAGGDVKAREIGEIIIKSRRNMSGYWRNPDATQKAIKNGWLYTGDMGYYDEQGYIYIADRKKDMIVTGGENVYPKEVEEVLYRHPAVLEAAVIGIPDDYWVERVHALVVLRQGAQASAEEIMDFCKSHIAHYKAPKGVEFLESLPKNPQGKILKKEIRKRYWREK